ncbi:MAG: transporter substrate-binding domain-containing protein [Christensenellales bacterium]
MKPFHKRKSIALSLCVLLLFSFLSGCARDPSAGQAMAQVRSRGVLRVGVYSNIPGFSALQNGEFLGLEADIARSVGGAIMGDSSKVELVPVNNRTRTFFLDDLSLDLSIAMIEGQEGSAKYVFSSPYYTDTFAFMVKDGAYSSLSQLAGKKVGVFYNSTQKTHLQNFIKESEIPFELVDVSSYQEAKEKLLLESPQLDAFCCETGALKNQLSSGLSLLSEGFGEINYCIAGLIANQDLITLATQKLEAMRESGELTQLIQENGL